MKNRYILISSMTGREIITLNITEENRAAYNAILVPLGFEIYKIH